LPAFYALTSADNTCSLAGKGKLTCCKAFKDAHHIIITAMTDLFWHAPLEVHYATRRHESPEWTILSHDDCFIHGEDVGFQVLLDSHHPRSTRAVLVHRHKLMSSHEKTELLWCTTSGRQHRRPTATLRVTVGSTTVAPVSSVRTTWAYLSTPSWRCALTCVGRCQAASQHCINFAVFAISCRGPSSSRCVGPLSARLWQWHGRPYPPTSWCRTQRVDWYSVSVDLTTSWMHSSASIGCECLKGLMYFQDRRAD